VPKVPSGRVSSLTLLFFSAIFGWYSYNSNDLFRIIVFIIMSLVCLFAGILIYAGFIPCKERVREKANPLLCNRCIGFYIGVTIFTVIIGIFHFYGAPIFSKSVGYLLVIAGLLSCLPAIIHGVVRRYLHKDLSPKLSTMMLYISGFLVAFGAFLIALAFISLSA